MTHVRGSCGLATLVATLALFGCQPSATPPPDTAMPPVGHVVLAGNCAQPIASDGGISLPDTATVQTSMRVIDLVNDGNVDIDTLTAVRWTIEGPDAADFTFDGTPEGDDSANCGFLGFLPPDIGVGLACHFAVHFHPTSPGAKQAILHIVKPYVVTLDQTFPLHGTATPPPTDLYASSPDVYLVNDGGFGGSFLITNAGATSVMLGDPTVAPPLTFDSWDCPATLTPGGACTVNLAPAPQNFPCPASEFSTTLSNLNVPLTARGEPSVLSISVQAAGSVVITPGGTVCTQAQSCDLMASVPQAFTLTATPDAGAHFSRWVDPATALTDSACGTSPTCTVQVGPESVYLIAMFTTTTAKSIAVTIVGTGTVTPVGNGGPACTSSCVMYAESGESLSLGAATTGTFDGWSGDCTNADPDCNLGTIENDRAVTATFTP